MLRNLFQFLRCTRSMISQKIYDSQKRAAEPLVPLCRELLALPGLTEGRAECFVDRRRDLQRLIPALREGGVQTLIITGPDGSGKSALAAHLVRLLGPGYSVLPIYSSPHNRITSARLLEAAVGHLSKMGEEAAAKSLKDPLRSVRERLKSWLEVLKASRILMVWDGLDLDGKTGKDFRPGSGRVLLADAKRHDCRARHHHLQGNAC